MISNARYNEALKLNGKQAEKEEDDEQEKIIQNKEKEILKLESRLQKAEKNLDIKIKEQQQQMSK